MFEATVEVSFAAAHNLREYPGKCARLHGHNFRVQVTAQARLLDATGMVLDFTALKGHLRAILEELDHGYLNEIPPFDRINPTTEALAKYLYDRLTVVIAPDPDRGLRLSRVWVQETDANSASYIP
jgi:6-pyruvoyltetrahydropterin/6-carboxytetrahydropterin synthase